jgi:hypothetical protein
VKDFVAEKFPEFSIYSKNVKVLFNYSFTVLPITIVMNMEFNDK